MLSWGRFCALYVRNSQYEPRYVCRARNADSELSVAIDMTSLRESFSVAVSVMAGDCPSASNGKTIGNMIYSKRIFMVSSMCFTEFRFSSFRGVCLSRRLRVCGI